MIFYPLLKLFPKTNRQGLATIGLIAASQFSLKIWFGQSDVMGFTRVAAAIMLALTGGIICGVLYFPRLHFPRYRVLAYVWGCLVELSAVGLTLAYIAWQGSANRWICLALFVISLFIGYSVYMILARRLWARERSGLSSRFKAGQVWRYKTRPDEARSLLTVTQVDFDLFETEPIVSIYVGGLHSPFREIMHLPLSESAMQNSIMDLVEENSVASQEMLSAYDTWRQAHEHGKAGVFCITVAELLVAMTQD